MTKLVIKIKKQWVVAFVAFELLCSIFIPQADATTSSIINTNTSQNTSSYLLQTSKGNEKGITTFATTGLPWYFSYAFDSNLDGATKFYYDSRKGRLNIYMSSRIPYLDYGDYGYSGDFKVTLMKIDLINGYSYAVSHAGYLRNKLKSVTFTYQYSGARLSSGYYWLKFSNPKPHHYITGSGKAYYVN
ncbi:hypothetical protein [Bacillus sp. SA1-12]|uniref:hypothetical protein n=1 Tax=Bacillus sp. SA1-12 TaxID=1455638 RepID=UPI0012E009D7|nr:hypothetical protein [Bacillus sp. SA1-12]